MFRETLEFHEICFHTSSNFLKTVNGSPYVLSPFLFIIYVNDILTNISRTTMGYTSTAHVEHQRSRYNVCRWPSYNFQFTGRTHSHYWVNHNWLLKGRIIINLSKSKANTKQNTRIRKHRILVNTPDLTKVWNTPNRDISGGTHPIRPT
jgi:hypothetical protein